MSRSPVGGSLVKTIPLTLIYHLLKKIKIFSCSVSLCEKVVKNLKIKYLKVFKKRYILLDLYAENNADQKSSVDFIVIM